MTTCVHPTNTTPGTLPYGGIGGYPGMMPANAFGIPTQAQPGFIQPPTGFANFQQFPVNQFPVNTFPFNGQPFNGFTNTFPAPHPHGFEGGTPWTNPYAFSPTPWTSGYPTSNPYGCAPTWNPWNSPQFNAFNPTNPYATPAYAPSFSSPWATTPVNAWNTPTFPAPAFPAPTPFGFVQNTNWQTPWNTGFNTVPTNTFNPTPFVGGYSPTQFNQGLVNPTTTGWNNLAAAINTLSQPTNWSPIGTTPVTTPWNGFNTTPWAGGFPTLGGFNPSIFNPAALNPAICSPSLSIPTPAVPSPFFNTPTFNTIPNAPFGYPGFFPGFPTGFTNSPWNTMFPGFGGFNPSNLVPFFPGQFVNPNTPGFNPGVPAGFTPGAPTTGVPTTRTNVQNNGDGSYRNAA